MSDSQSRRRLTLCPPHLFFFFFPFLLFESVAIYFSRHSRDRLFLEFLEARFSSSAHHSRLLPLPSPLFTQVRNGHIKRITDSDIQSLVIEIMGANVSTTYITCPADPKETLGIKLPFLVMIVKNMKKYFTFEVQVRFSAEQICCPRLVTQRAPNLLSRSPPNFVGTRRQECEEEVPCIKLPEQHARQAVHLHHAHAT